MSSDDLFYHQIVFEKIKPNLGSLNLALKTGLMSYFSSSINLLSTVDFAIITFVSR